MPSFDECLMSAVEQGAVTRQEAAELQAEFAERFAQARLSMGDGPARSAAKEGLEKRLRAEAAERRRQVLLDAGIGARLKTELKGYRTPKGEADVFSAAMFELSQYGLAGFTSMRERYESIFSLAHTALADHIRTFRRTWFSGRRENRPLADDVIDALHGDPVKDPKAKGLAASLAKVAEDLRQRRNAAGGATPKRDDWGWSHIHDRRRIAAFVEEKGREAYKDFLRQRLNPEKMRSALTGEALSADELEKGLDKALDSILSQGWVDATPSKIPAGRGALASQGQEHRFLIFKSGAAWREYDAMFGNGDPVAAWFEHIKREAQDIAAMEHFGPNPGARVEWMIQVVRNEIGKGQAGRSSLARQAGLDAGDKAEWRIRALYNYMRGRPTVSAFWADSLGDVRNALTSAQLGFTSALAMLTDPFIDAGLRRLAGLPMTGALTATVKAFVPEQISGLRDSAVRAGFMMDDFVHILKDEARETAFGFGGPLNGREWSRWLADRAVHLSLLKPLTQARRHLHMQEWMAHLADNAGKRFEDIDPLTRRTMQGFGIDATDWNVMRAAPLFKPSARSAGFLRPADIAALADGPALPNVQKLLGIDAGDQAARQEQARAGVRRVAEKYIGMVQSWTERAVPSGTPNARSAVVGDLPRGSIPSEILEGILQYKGFSLSFTTLQWQVGQMEMARGGGWAVAKHAAPLFFFMTLGAAGYLQLKAIGDGKDPEDMTDPRFWQRAALTGGGLGIFGDFFADYARNGHNLFTTIGGPQSSLFEDTFGAAFTGFRQLAGDEDANTGRAVTQLLRRNTPIVSTHWATRAAWNRVAMDQLQYMLDPDATKSFRAMENSLKGRTGQRYFWPPGSGPAPERSPDFGAAAGG